MIFSIIYGLKGHIFGFIFFLIISGIWGCTVCAKGVFKTLVFIQAIVITFFFSISFFLTPIADEFSRYALLGVIGEEERYYTINAMTFLALLYVGTVTFLSQIANIKLSLEDVKISFAQLFTIIIFLTLFRIVSNYTFEENLIRKLLNFAGAYYRLDLVFLFVIVFGFRKFETQRRTIWNTLVYFLLTTLGGSKEAIFRIAYSFAIFYRTNLLKIKFDFLTLFSIIIVIFLIPLSIFVATAVRYQLSINYNNFYEFMTGASYFVDGSLVKLVLSRLSGADDIIWTFNKGHIFEQYYTISTAIKSVVDYVVPLQVFDSLPLTNYINLSRGFTMTEAREIYSSKEITLMGSVFHLSGSSLIFSCVYMLILGIITYVVFISFKGHPVYLVTMLYASFYFMRSLSIDDTFGMTINYLLSAWIMFSTAKLLGRIKLF